MRSVLFTDNLAGTVLAVSLLLTACQAPAPQNATPVAGTPSPLVPTATSLPSATPWPTIAFPTEIPGATPSPTLPPTEAPAASTAPAAPAITEVTAGDWVTGPATAQITLIEYSDYQCAPCAQLANVLLQIRQEYPDDVRLVHRHFPVIWLTAEDKPVHDKSELATEAAEAAGAQGKFWAMHTVLFSYYSQWAEATPTEFRTMLTGYADAAGLDEAQFAADLDSHKFAQRVQDALVAAANYRVGSAPVVFFNGEPYQGPRERWAFSTLIKLEKFKERQFTTAPPQVIDPFRQYFATLHTTKGDIVIELYVDQAPVTVNNFVFLAQQGWYNGITFHTVVAGYAQTGDPTDTGWGMPGYFIPDEISPDLKYDAAGWVGMANTGPNTNGCQFFVTRLAQPALDGKHTLFGKVIGGLEVLAQLTPRNPEENHEAPPGDVITSLTIEEK